jgi:PAS domain S-box-containing protein
MSYREFESLQAVDRFLNLKINSKDELQEIVELASVICETPIALITLMDENTQYIKFKVGTHVKRHAKADTFCQYLGQHEEELMIVNDALKDDRFSHHPIVTGAPHIRFYAGVPLITHDGLNMGSLCVMSTEPKEFTGSQKRLIKVLGKRIIQIMEFGFSLRILKKQFLQAKNSEIKLLSFFESVGTCHLLIGTKMEVIAFNKNMADFIERFYQLKLYAGQQMKEIMKEENFDVFLTNYHKVLMGESMTYERDMILDGKVMWWSVTLEPGYNAEGEVIGISYNAADITERKVQEQQILEQNDSLMKIAHIQSHELRRPVASILGLVELFKSNDYLSTQEELMMLARAAKELDDKIRAIVALTE